jgi:hypothetical protein
MEENFRLKLELVEKGDALRRAAADAAGLQAGMVSRAALLSMEAKNQVLLKVRPAAGIPVCWGVLLLHHSLGHTNTRLLSRMVACEVRRCGTLA